MHICHFCATSVEGAYFRNIAIGLVEKGAQVSVLELGPDKPPSWLDQIPQVKYFSLEACGKANLPLAAWKLARLLKNEGVDIVHTHLYDAGLVAGLAKYLNKKPVYVYMRHHTSVVRMLGTRIHVTLDKWMAERADQRVAVSPAVRKYMQEVDQITANIDVVYLGFDFEVFKPDMESRKRIRNEFGFSEDEFVIGYVANLVPAKGHGQLIEAFASIAKTVREARLFLVGGGSFEEPLEIVQRLNLGTRVVFSGWRDDTPACLNAMDLFIQPSLSEAFSQVLIEAMGVGLPVIATDVGGAAEVLMDGENGILILPDAPEEIASKILDLYSQPKERDRIARSARRSVIDNFSVKRLVNKQFDLYRKWLEFRIDL